jgi:hypothetical protein
VILITNSQGHVRRNGGVESYPAQLGALLNHADPRHSYIVANWSVPGGNAPEMIVLAARAAAHHPDVVLLVSYSRNFTHQRRDPSLGATGIDVSHLAYVSQTRRHLSPWFLELFRVTDFRGWLAARRRLVQLRETFVSMVKGGTARQRPTLIEAKPWTERSSQLLNDFRQTIRRGLPQTPLLVVSMPLNPHRFTQESWPNVRAFTAQAHAQFDHQPEVAVLDATDLVDPALFTDETHMVVEGHERFAHWLLSQLMPVLASKEGCCA